MTQSVFTVKYISPVLRRIVAAVVLLLLVVFSRSHYVLGDRIARSTIGYWHDNVCLSVGLSEGL